MYRESPLVAEYQRLKDSSNPTERGRDLELLISQLFRRAHFRVERNAGSAAPRQTDLTAINGARAYLIEAKWLKARANVSAVDEVRIRLADTPVGTVGLLISVSGFTKNAISRASQKRERPVLLMTGDELATALAWPQDLPAVLQNKMDDLVINGQSVPKVQRNRARDIRDTVRRYVHVEDSPIFLINGEAASVVSCGGDYGRFIFSSDLPDIDWVTSGGAGVSLDIQSPVETQDDLLAIMAELSEAGWLSDNGHWNIQQAERNWHGIGITSLVTNIINWRDRYSELQIIHHTEEVSYQDSCRGGFFTFTTDISASERRRVSDCNLSFRLIGIPVELAPFQQIDRILRGELPLYFRPQTERSVEGHGLYDLNRAVVLHGLVVERDMGEQWVSGIIVSNPFADWESNEELRWLPRNVADSDLLICSLRQWHTLDQPIDSYRFERCEWAWTSDALVFRAIANWDGPALWQLPAGRRFPQQKTHGDI